MSVLRQVDDGLDDLLDSLLGSASNNKQSTVFTEKKSLPTLGLTGTAKNAPPNKEEYVSKYDKMEDGHMASKVIRTQLVKGEKAANTQKKFEQAEKIRLEAVLGKYADEKMKKRKNQLASSSDDGSDIEPTNKLGVVQHNINIKKEKDEKIKNEKENNNNNNVKSNKQLQSSSTTPQKTTTPTTSKNKKNKPNQSKQQQQQPIEDEVVELFAD